MIPSVPIPTDNVFKFVALFGIVVFISSMLAVAYLTSKNNERVIGELKVLQDKEYLTIDESNQKVILERRSKLYISETKVYLVLLFVFVVCGSYWSIWGLYSWFKEVQPKQDELLNLQIEKMKREIQVLDRQQKSLSSYAYALVSGRGNVGGRE